jgi:hypothetical protein
VIDEFIKDKAAPAARKTTRKAVRTAKKSLANVGSGVSDWFRDFRWIELTASVSAAFAAGMAMATSMALPEPIARKIGLFGAMIGAICYVRSPKTKWEGANEPVDPKE